ncbi:hypothetical protein [Pantoea sp.]|uniref:hypothetical protein n=1 Tax=Pantoea sp. TaxID=69393 RepID=UPI0028A7DBE9|nr:hypothetical protein [Pantoea sp.]
MKPQFSEFTYGYALIEEFSRKYNFTSVPIFPSLVEEGRVGGGYDAGLKIQGIPFFFQFKKSNFLSRSHSKYYKSFNTPYYQFYLHAKKYSKQHELLLHLENSGNPVFYIAPKFHTNVELHDNYFNSTIGESSICISPKQIGILPDNEEHSICFNKDSSLIYFCSNPKLIEYNISLVKFKLHQHLNDLMDNDVFLKYHRETWAGIYSQMEYIVKRHYRDHFNKLFIFLESIDNVILRTARLARIVFDLNIAVFNTHTDNRSYLPKP